jgi:hypothetical protein
MLEFDTEIPQSARGLSLPVIRTPNKGTIHGLITCDNLIGTNTHFYGGRTVPCMREECDACKDGAPFRWHAYLTCYNGQAKQHFIFECTALAAESFYEYLRANGTLRGCMFNARRGSSRANARVILELKPYAGDRSSIPHAPNLILALAKLWNIPITDVKAPTATKRTAALEAFSAERAAASIDPHEPRPNGKPAVPRE